MKKLDKWVSDELTENQINHHFEVLFSLILHSINTPFLDHIVTCDEKRVFYDSWQQPAQGLDRESPKHFPKPNLQPPQKKVTVTVWWSAARLIHYSFLNPDKAITAEKYAQQISEIHQNLQRLQPALVNRKSPILLHDSTQLTSHNQRFKSWSNWGKIFCPILHIHLTSHQPMTTSPSVLTTFCEENASTKNKR